MSTSCREPKHRVETVALECIYQTAVGEEIQFESIQSAKERDSNMATTQFRIGSELDDMTLLDIIQRFLF